MNTESSDFPLLLKRVVNKLGRPYGINPFPRAFPNPLASGSGSRSTVFDHVYSSNFWGSAQSRSGVGSEEAFATAYRDKLEALLLRRGFRSVFDAPCGDLNWMGDLAERSSWTYEGGDISQLVVEDALARHPRLSVEVFDICEDPFPQAEVWHCRDCLFHLPFADIKKAFANFARSGIPYALFTTHRARLLHRNLDVSLGGFRYLDLERAPFNLPVAEQYLEDYRRGTEFPRYVGLWSQKAIQESLARWTGQT